MKALIACLVIFSYTLTNSSGIFAQKVKKFASIKPTIIKKEKELTSLMLNYKQFTNVHLTSILTESTEFSNIDKLIIDLLLIFRLIITFTVFILLVILITSSLFYHEKFKMLPTSPFNFSFKLF